MIQKKFIKTSNYRHNQRLFGVDYNICLTKYRIMGLEKENILFDEVFLNKTLNIYFNYSLTNYISFNVQSYRGRCS